MKKRSTITLRAPLLAVSVLLASVASVLGAAPAAEAGHSASTAAVQATQAGCPASDPSCPYRSANVLGDDGKGLFRFPQGIAFSPDNRFVYVADDFSYKMQKFTRSGEFVSQWGSFGRGRGEFGQLGGVATDVNGHVYVLDSENNRVQVFDADGRYMTQFGKTGARVGQFAVRPNGGIAIRGSFAFIADLQNHRIQRIPIDVNTGEANLRRSAIRTWGRFGDCAALKKRKKKCTGYDLNFPQGVTVSQAGDVFVADNRNARVVKYDINGKVKGIINKRGLFGSVYDVGVDSTNTLYVDDNDDRPSQRHHRVQAFDAATLGQTASWGGFGPQPGRFEFPRALAALDSDPAGGVYVTDTANNRVQGFDRVGNLTANFGRSGRKVENFTMPDGVSVAPNGALFVADTVNRRVQELGPNGEIREEWGRLHSGGSTGAGIARARTSNHAGGDPAPGPFQVPSAIDVDDRTGEVYVADRERNRVIHFDPIAREWQPLGETQIRKPDGVTVDGSGNVYVSDTGNTRVQRLDYGTGQWSVVAGGTKLRKPTGITSDAEGNVFVADSEAKRILRMPRSSRSWSRLSTPTLRNPHGLDVDNEGRLLVADAGSHRIARLTRQGGALQGFGSKGQGTGQFIAPRGVASDRSGNLFVADTYNNRVQTFSVSEDGPAQPPPVAAPNSSPDTLTPRTTLEVLPPRIAKTPRSKKGRKYTAPVSVQLLVTCSERCGTDAQLFVSDSAAARLGLPSTLIAQNVRGVSETRKKKITLTLPTRPKALLETLTLRDLRVTLDVADAAGNAKQYVPNLRLRSPKHVVAPPARLKPGELRPESPGALGTRPNSQDGTGSPQGGD